MSTKAALHLAAIIRDLHAAWKPHPAQQAIIRAIFGEGKKVVMLECGRKFGKTELDAYFLWRLALTRPGEYYFFIPLQVQVREVVWANKRLQNFGPQQYIEDINESEMRIKFKNGSFIKADGSDSFDKYRGPNPKGAVYDEFRDFRPEFHPAFGPNLATFNAPLLINGTPPDTKLEHYDEMVRECKAEPDRAYFQFPSWANPFAPRDWLRKEKRLHIARGDEATWAREFEARQVFGGKRSIFPMYDAPDPDSVPPKPHTKHFRPHAEVMAEIYRDRRKLIWQNIADPGTSSCFAMLFRAVNPYTKKVYRLDEIYETDQALTSTSLISPRAAAIRAELFPDAEACGMEWDLIYDEAETWFAAEALNSFGEHWTPTQKATKDIKTGISLLKDQLLRGKTVISDRCVNLSKEMIGFVKDPKTDKPHRSCADHAIDCIAGYERILTEHGYVPIKDVECGDLVWTRVGWRPIRAVMYKGEREIIRLHFSNGYSLDCTPDHAVFTTSGDLFRACDLLPTDRFYSARYGDDLWPSLLSSKEKGTGATPRQSDGPTASTTRPATAEDHSIAPSGRPLTALFPRDTTSTTGTGTQTTTRSKTWSACLRRLISMSITWGSRLLRSEPTSPASGQRPLHGTARKKASDGISSTGGTASPQGQSETASAPSAGSGISQSLLLAGSAPTSASPHGGEAQESTTSKASARVAPNHSRRIAMMPLASAPSLARIETLGKISAVYDISVTDTPEFFASGILVHNCDRYGNDYAGIDLSPEAEPEAVDPDRQSRYSTPEKDIENDAADDDDAFGVLDDF